MSQSFFNKQKNKSIPLLDRKSTNVHNEICKKKKIKGFRTCNLFHSFEPGVYNIFSTDKKTECLWWESQHSYLPWKLQTLVAWWSHSLFLIMYATTTFYPTKIYCKIEFKRIRKSQRKKAYLNNNSQNICTVDPCWYQRYIHFSLKLIKLIKFR